MVSPINVKLETAAQFTRPGGYFCILLLSLPEEYPIPKQVKPKLSTAISPNISIWLSPPFPDSFSGFYVIGGSQSLRRRLTTYHLGSTHRYFTIFRPDSQLASLELLTLTHACHLLPSPLLFLQIFIMGFFRENRKQDLLPEKNGEKKGKKRINAYPIPHTHNVPFSSLFFPFFSHLLFNIKSVAIPK